MERMSCYIINNVIICVSKIVIYHSTRKGGLFVLHDH